MQIPQYLTTDDGFYITTDDGYYIVVGYEERPDFTGTFSYTIGL